jgi:hypothetical protein
MINDKDFASADDIMRMIDFGIVGQAPGMVALGAVRQGEIILREPGSVLVLSSSEDYSLNGVVIPTILSADEASLVIQDPTGALFDTCSGHRAKLGPVFQYKWDMADDEAGDIPYPSWNPLSRFNLPKPGPGRDLYLRSIVRVLLGQRGTRRFGDDDRIQTLCESLLIAIIKALLKKAAKNNWSGLPREWRNLEPSFPMVADWITTVLGGRRYTDLIGPCRRALRDPSLEVLVRSDSDTRHAILFKIAASLAIFRDPAVRDRTSSSTIGWNALRGTPVRNVAGSEVPAYLPSTVFLSTDEKNIRSHAILSALYLEAAYCYLLDNAPGMRDGGGVLTGTTPCGILLTNAPAMPRLASVVDGARSARGSNSFLLVCARDYEQLLRRYTDEDLERIEAAMVARIAARTYSAVTAERFLREDPLDRRVVMALPEDMHLLFVNGMEKPVLCRRIDPATENELRDRIFVKHGLHGPFPAPPMPGFWMGV